MSKFWMAALVAVAFPVAVTVTASADPLAEIYVEDALPHMYHSCQSVVDEADGDDLYIDKVVRSLVAMSLYNRDVDASVFAVNDEEKAAMHDRFVAGLKKGCEEDPDALLAGVIDYAVADALWGNSGQ
jgi:hypothetical protein